MHSKNEIGVIIDSGAEDWQIFQQDSAGVADIRLSGRWKTEPDFRSVAVFVRLMNECNNEVVTQALQWRPAETHLDGSWSATLPAVPSGGLYRIETVLQKDGSPLPWSQRGDMVHHVGVGDIWLITGQSNATGYGRAPAHDGPELGLHMFHARGHWQLASHPLDDSTQTIYPASREYTNASHSPWLAFARKLKNALHYPIGLIPASLGGSPLSAWDRATDGHLYENMLRHVKDAGENVRGAVWYQGESDANPQAVEEYAERFTRFVADLRKSLGHDQLPVITAQLNRWTGTGAVNDTVWNAIRELQRQLPKQISDVFVVPTADLGLADGIHNNSSSNLVIGDRMARVALGAVYGRDIAWRFPECDKAQLVAANQIQLSFSHVGIGLAYDNARVSDLPFAVRDENGQVGIASWQLSGPNQITLILARDLEGQASVTGIPGCNPSMIIPHDLDGYRPMLAFTQPVERE